MPEIQIKLIELYPQFILNSNFCLWDRAFKNNQQSVCHPNSWKMHAQYYFLQKSKNKQKMHCGAILTSPHNI